MAAVLLGCPGTRKIDLEAREKLWTWMEEQDANGWNITGYPDKAGYYKNIIATHRFRQAPVLDVAIKGDEVNPYHQRNWMVDIARKWWNLYPANMRPRFNLRVNLYDTEISHDMELGFVEVDKDGNFEPHHFKTGDVM
jgi:hypothetical protein